MIADVCHNLPRDFIPKSRRTRERHAVESLDSTCGTLNLTIVPLSGSSDSYGIRGSTTFVFSEIAPDGSTLENGVIWAAVTVVSSHTRVISADTWCWWAVSRGSTLRGEAQVQGGVRLGSGDWPACHGDRGVDEGGECR